MQHTDMSAAGISTAPVVWDQWLCEIEHFWQNEAKEEVALSLARAFNSVAPRDLHAFVLHLLDKSQDLRRMKPSSLGLIILQEFSWWVQEKRQRLPKDLSGIITDGMKLQALRLATSAHFNLFDMICILYHLQCEGNEYLATHLRILLARKQFKEAGVAAYKLKLQHCFKIEEICLPLIFQDKVNLVEKYMQDSKKTQVELLQRLDSFCAKNFDLQQVIANLDVPGVRKEKLRPKNLSKLIVRLAKLFKLDLAICPNTSFHRDLAAVRFLLYKKYIEQTLDAENWDELICNTIRDNTALQEEFINLLMEYNDPPAAAKWAVHYGIDQSKLAADVAGAIEMHNACPPPSDEPDNWDVDALTPQVPFYQLNLPLGSIVMVDNFHLLEVCERHITQEDKLIGIDMEWTPCFTATQTTRVAIVQLATFSRIYLLDMPALMASEADMVVIFFHSFLSSSRALKLGYGISGDFQMLTKSYPSLKGAVSAVQRLVDLCSLTEQILKAEPDFLKRPEASETDPSSSSVKGLSELTLMCFGRALDKKEQLSDWEKRPLRSSQLQYAALDALCLLEIYSFLKDKVRDAWLDINMEPAYQSGMAKQPKSKSKEPKKPRSKVISQGFKSSIQGPNQPLRPGEFSVVCDTMLQGLGRQLRACGVDTKILDNADEHDEAAKIAVREGRIILTAGTPYQTLKSQVGEGRCLSVDTKCNARQQAIQVLEYYNVRVSQEDVFSRCQACNNDAYVQISNEDMRRLWLKKKELLGVEGTATEIPVSSEGIAAEIPPSKEDTKAKAPSSIAHSGSAKYLTSPLHEYDSDSDDDDGGLLLDSEDFEHGPEDYYDIARPTFEAKSYVNEKVVSSMLSDGASSVPQVANPSYLPTESTLSKTTHLTDFQFDPFLESTGEGFVAVPATSLILRRSNPHYKPPVDCDLQETINFDTVTVGNNVPLQVEHIRGEILQKVQNFFCCSRCGKTFWEGTHFDRVVSQFSDILDLSSEPNV
ncbi:exonuclease mut-7 homolog [Acanthaster planci]|uniref:Exonuclease mut-7 homolog n=1 Tax=Acanthaster planci TaxID=133434 RepID=A0A8B7ZM52_ACAPL|nr:exonuclease mut-7 homolog [Acanthaster planci]